MYKESDFIFGLRAVIEAIKANKEIDRLLIKQGLSGILYHELITEVKARNIPYQIVPSERIELITRKNHQGVVAWLSLIEYQNIENLLPMIFEKGEEPLIIVLDGISDVRNFGAIVRTASCLGAHAIIIPEKGAAKITPDAIKTSAGALHSFPICRVKSLSKIIEYLKNSGLKIISASEKSDKTISETVMTDPVVLVIGSEDQGINKAIITLSDHIVKIPMTGNIGSLNVSVSAGILLYEITRQRSL